MCYWQIYLPLRDAQLYAPDVSYSYKGVAVGPMSLIAGVILCFAPEDYDWMERRFIREERSHTYFNIILLVTVLLAAFGTIYWFHQTLADLGIFLIFSSYNLQFTVSLPMLKSMTGYGLISNDFAHAKYTVEIKSLNSKFLELSLKLPKAFSDKELFLRNECSKQIERGKVGVTVTVEYPENLLKTASINKNLLKLYYNQLRETADELKDNSSNLLQLALNFPDVVQYGEDAISDEEWRQLLRTFEEAMANFQTFRRDEGRVLQQDLVLRINNILQAMQKVEVQEPNRIPMIRERLQQLLEEHVGKDAIDQNRFEQELIYYIDKLDITEEKIRLKSHCDYFLETLKSPEANGKKLGFISQEIGREINTMGSKANDAQIQQIVVGMKEELEKIKEQLLNVL